MATAPMTTVIDRLRQTALSQDHDASTDAHLLAAFIEQKDEAAFTALVRRHGPMVLSVCDRVVRNHHDAEDAFQAAFLVLARKASSIRPRSMVANWLHGVAYRTALKARTMRTKRQACEKQVAQVPEPEAAQPDPWTDLQPVLDEELHRLPANYRLAILLCDIEGKPIKAAAEQLGWPQGTLAGRLARARRLLAKRLTQRGIVLSGGALALLLAEKAASAGVSVPLATSTVKAAIAVATGETATTLVAAQVRALMEGVLKGMILTKLKTITAVLLLACLIAVGGSAFSRPAAIASQGDDQVSKKPASPLADDQSSKKPASPNASRRPKSIDETLLHGEWVGRVMGLNCSLIFGPTNKIRRILEGRDPGPNEAGTYFVDWKQKPYRLEVKWGSQPAAQAIIDFPEKNKLRIESGPRQDGLPQKFSNTALVLTKREKAEPGSNQAEKDADRDLASAEFYHRTKKFASAYFYYELVRLRYPDSIQASRAQEGLQALQEHRIRRADGTEGWDTDPAQQPSLTPPLPPQVPPDIAITGQELQQLKQLVKALEGRIRALEASRKVQPGTSTGSYAPSPPLAVEALRQQIRDLDSRLRLLESGSKGKQP